MSLFSFRYYKWLRLGLLIGTDALIIIASFWFAYVIRLESLDVENRIDDFRQALPIFILVHLLTFYVGRMYRQVWRYANFNSALLIARLTFIATVASTALVYIFEFGRVPRSIPIIFWLLMVMGITLVKFSWRVYATAGAGKTDSKTKERCIVYGAGSAGELLARHVTADPHFPYKIVGFIDDDANKKNRIIHGLKIFGTGDDLETVARKHNVQTVVIAIHAAPGSVIRGIVENCRRLGIKSVIMPDMANSLENDVFQPRKIDIKDLLRRAPKEIDKDSVKKLLRDSTVLVTGAGGSIGSEIARQILSYAPRKLLLLDNTEFNLYRIEQELRDSLNQNSTIEIIPVLGSASDKRVVENLFNQHKPQYVLHAAAYKHVPMVEANPREGVINNILSTKLLAEAAIRHNAKKFLLVSTDKSVRPTNIMGATKRCCELLIQAISASAPAGSTCSFCAVRFGNVLGSSGSVIPRFLEQIQAGGPITVTHPDVTRYFMLTSEAVALVLQSIAMAKGGEIFVLNMGTPIKIYEMAKQLIWLSGRKPESDIEIRFTGLRPGEKLYEELIIEDVEQPTLHEDVFVAKSHLDNPPETLFSINSAIDFALDGNTNASLDLVKKLASWSAPNGTLTN